MDFFLAHFILLSEKVKYYEENRKKKKKTIRGKQEKQYKFYMVKFMILSPIQHKNGCVLLETNTMQ